MDTHAHSADHGSRSAVRRLLIAVDRSLAAAREVQQARAALERESSRGLRLCGVPDEREDGKASGAVTIA
jgi:hypothetical protein